jgi:hypothetical protein
MESNRDAWSKDELEEVFKIYFENRNSIHKENKNIVKLASELNKKVRGVENQLLMFRAVEKEIEQNSIYGRKNYNKLVKLIYIEQTKNSMNNSEYSEFNSRLNSYPYKFKNFVKTNDGAVRRSDDKNSGRPIGEMIKLPIHEFINKAINLNNNHNILFLIGGPGNGKTDATDYAFENFISKNNVSEGQEDIFKSEYLAGFAVNDNYFSKCSINGKTFICIQDATVRMKSVPTNIDAFNRVFRIFESEDNATLLICINRGVLQDFIIKETQNHDVLEILKIAENTSNLDAYFKEKSNLNVVFKSSQNDFNISSFPLDKSSLFSLQSEINNDVSEIILKSNWENNIDLNFQRSNFQSIHSGLSDLINLYEIKNNKKLTFREYYHWLYLLFTPERFSFKFLIDSPLLHLWKIANNESIDQISLLIKKLEKPDVKQELLLLVNDLKKVNLSIDQNKTINAVQEFNPNLIAKLWDTEEIYSLITNIRDQITDEPQNRNKSSLVINNYHLDGINGSEIKQLIKFVDLYSKIDSHILDSKTKEIESIRKFMLIVIRNFLCAIDFRLKGLFNLKFELNEFRKLNESESNEIRGILIKLMRLKDDGSGFFKMKVALNNNIWEYSFNSENVIEGEIDDIEKAFVFKKINFEDKPPIELKLFVSKFLDGPEIITYVDFGTFLNIKESKLLFNPDFKRVASTISPNFKLWLNSEAEKFVSGRFKEINSISIPGIAKIHQNSKKRISIEKI